MIVRKTIFIRETLTADEMGRKSDPATRVAAMAVVRNPFAGQDQTDLSDLFDVAAKLGTSLSRELVLMLPRAAVSYGKAALVGVAGTMEHGAAVLHPKLGAPMRASIGGGKALIPANHKIGSVGDRIDLPLGHKG
ncbi:amino acid synthesis family protein [Roseovarius faecimaris]|uniref:amino acid synthesis family protein n=1 Tax=Roseovarius faecimaris TaxID=2494550 RepID=UPI001FEB7B0F|nr:amino acid synthesis family protein [Roseovarius faecimaris]